MDHDWNVGANCGGDGVAGRRHLSPPKGAADAAAAVKTEVPVSRVVLFSSGVGYFEHKGTIAGDANVQLSFKVDQINDILKSLIVMSKTSQVTGITFASKEPLLRALRSFAIDLSGQPTMADLLKQVRGNEVTVMAPDKITGKIVSIETETEQVLQNERTGGPDQDLPRPGSDGTFRRVNLATVQGLTLTDPKLQSELAKALELLSQAPIPRPSRWTSISRARAKARSGSATSAKCRSGGPRIAWTCPRRRSSRAGPSAKTPRITTGTTCG